MNEKTLSIIVRAQDDASKVLEKVGKSTQDVSERFASAAGTMAKVGALAGAAALATGITLSTKAAWNQVGAVQQATVALGAYEKDGAKVSRTLSDLVKYARSDMGVLFQRQDLFAAAQGLKIMGDNTDSLTDHVKIMSRSVGLGLSTFEGLGNVIQRVGSTGVLYANDLQFLQNAGFRLDGSLSGTTQTFESLFALLDKGIPAEAMAGQSDTISGKMVQLQSAFRDVGLRILGVDRDTSQFIEGGLGARMISAIDSATNALRTIAPAVESIISAFLTATAWIGQHQIVLAIFAGIIGALVIPAFIAWAVAAASAAAATLLAMAPVILLGAVIGAVAYLIIAHWDKVKSVFATVFQFIVSTWSTIVSVLLGPIGVAIALVITHFNSIRNVVSSVVGFIASAFQGAKNTISSIWSGVTGVLTNPIEAAKNTIKGVIDQIGHWISNITGKIDQFQNTASSVVNSFKGKIPGFASGVRNFSGGMAVVGERGPELVNLPKGSDVFSNRESMSMGAGGGTNITISGTVNINTPEAATAFWDRVDQTARLSRMGMA